MCFQTPPGPNQLFPVPLSLPLKTPPLPESRRRKLWRETGGGVGVGALRWIIDERKRERDQEEIKTFDVAMSRLILPPILVLQGFRRHAQLLIAETCLPNWLRYCGWGSFGRMLWKSEVPSLFTTIPPSVMAYKSTPSPRSLALARPRSLSRSSSLTTIVFKRSV